MTKGTTNASDKIVGRLCHTPRRFAFLLSAEGAIHFPPPQLAMHTDLIRAFSGCLLGIRIPGAIPQANNDIAPLALNAQRFTEPSRGDASETDGQVEGRVSGKRTSQTPYNRLLCTLRRS